jgi:hypothetical protein
MEYIKGPKNIVADTLSHLEMTSDMESLDMADCYVSILMTFQTTPFQSHIP